MKDERLLSDNPELLHYSKGKLHITILGGIKFTGLDRLKVTLKVLNRDNSQKVFRHNVDLYNSIQTGQLVERASDYLDIPTATVNETIDQLTTALEEYRAAHLESLKPKPQQVKQLSEAERKAAITFLKASNLIKQTAEAITQSGIVGEETNALIAYLIYTSRKRSTPLHLMCLGASGTGKTWLQEKVGELIPEEDKLEITTLTTNAFYYFGKEELKHKLLLIEDLDGADNVLYPLRELQSKRRISKTVTLKDSITILGGIKFTGLERLKVTLKVVNRDNSQKVFRHNVDLYNSIQTGQLVERAADYLDIPTATVNETIDQLTTALEEYRAAHLESLKPSGSNSIYLA